MPLCRDPGCPLFPVDHTGNPHEKHSLCQFCGGITSLEEPDHSECIQAQANRDTQTMADELGIASLSEWAVPFPYLTELPFLTEAYDTLGRPGYWVPDLKMMAL